jgi:hypothetical protein
VTGIPVVDRHGYLMDGRFALVVDEGVRVLDPVRERLLEAVREAEAAVAGEASGLRLGTATGVNGGTAASRLGIPRDIDAYAHIYVEGSRGELGEIGRSPRLAALLAEYTRVLTGALERDSAIAVSWIATDGARYVRNYKPKYWRVDQLLAEDGMEFFRSQVPACLKIAVGASFVDGDLPVTLDVQVARSVRARNGPVEVQPSDTSIWFGHAFFDARSHRVAEAIEAARQRMPGPLTMDDRYRQMCGGMMQQSWRSGAHLTFIKKLVRLMAFLREREWVEEALSDTEFLDAVSHHTVASRLETCVQSWREREDGGEVIERACAAAASLVRERGCGQELEAALERLEAALRGSGPVSDAVFRAANGLSAAAHELGTEQAGRLVRSHPVWMGCLDRL